MKGKRPPVTKKTQTQKEPLLNAAAPRQKKLYWPKLGYDAVTAMEIWPERFVPKPDMEVINKWPDAWNKALPRLRAQPLMLSLAHPARKRQVAPLPPAINKLASVWIDYPGYPQGSRGWHDQRFNFIISGSRVGTILGHNPYQPPSLLFDMMIGKHPVDLVNHHMLRGTKFEPVAMEYCERELGWVLLDMPLIHHRDWERYPILVVSLDRLFAGKCDGSGQNILRIVECKCPFEIKDKNVELYNDQMQLQMEVVTSHLGDKRQRNECECFLFQYRDRTWTGTGHHEYKMDRVEQDPSWLNNAYPHLLDFDQRVRRSRRQFGIDLATFNKLNADSLELYNVALAQLREADGGKNKDELLQDEARRIQVESHYAKYREIVEQNEYEF